MPPRTSSARAALDLVIGVSLALAAAACAPADPSDDPADWDVDTSVAWEPAVSAAHFVVPSDALPVVTNASNNNVAIAFFEGRLFLAWRTAPTHWASDATEMHIVSSGDGGVTWQDEASFSLGTDMREPQLFVVDGVLHFTCFQAGTNTFAFEPKQKWKSRRTSDGAWAELEKWGDDPTEVPWEIKVRGGRAFMTSYSGNHYGSGPSDVRVHLKVSDDGERWSDVGAADVYAGGCSEAGFEIDADGSAWTVLRNEDGDDTGFGSLVCHAPASDLSAWDCPAAADPERYDSPRMLRHGDDIYLVARRDIDGPFDEGRTDLDLQQQRDVYAADYWTRPKRTSLYRIDKAQRRVVRVMDLPSAGDTAFASIRRTGPDSFLVANYTSPVDDPNRTWLEGQGAPDGTSIYLIQLVFTPSG